MPNLMPPSFAIRAAMPDRRVFSSSSSSTGPAAGGISLDGDRGDVGSGAKACCGDLTVFTVAVGKFWIPVGQECTYRVRWQ